MILLKMLLHMSLEYVGILNIKKNVIDTCVVSCVICSGFKYVKGAQYLIFFKAMVSVIDDLYI